MGSLSAEEYFYKLDNMVLSSGQLLRKVFQSRWKEKTGTEWKHTEEQGKLFLESKDGEKVQKNCKPLQKKMIESGCLDDWDMTLVSLVLQNFGDENSYKVENEAVKQLTRLRNELAHHPTKKLSREDYNTNVDLFRVNLQALGVKSCEIEEMIERAGITSSVAALEATKYLLEKGEMHLKALEFEKAIPFFDEATTMPSLLPVHEGYVYEKRAECYLKQGNYLKQKSIKSDGDKCVEQAMLDATLALQLNDSSWKAHVLIAQCHRWNISYEQAIQHYNKALALSPTQKHVKIELDSCKVLAGARTYRDNMDPRNAPTTFTEMLASCEEQTGIKLTEEQWTTLMKYSTNKGQGHAFKGHQYLEGWSVPQNDEEAARHFAKAAEVGNSEGIFHLALCYFNGKGITQDLDKAYKLCLQVANMSPHLGGCVGLVDGAVVGAQHALGVLFQEGILVEQDYFEAVKWYEKAVENGSGLAAHNLALMYFQGQGVPANPKKAEMYWNQAVILKDPQAAAALMQYYILHMEPEKARAMYQTGKELGNDALNGISEDEFNKMAESIFDPFGRDRKQLEAGVTAFERMNKLDTKGMTFFERYQRQVIGNDSKMEKVMKNIKEAGSNNSWGGMLSETGMDFDVLDKMASEGSITAQNVMEANYNAWKLATFLKENECKTDTEKKYVFDLLYKCCTGEYHVATAYLHNTSIKNKVKTLIGELFNSRCGEKGEVDMKIRFSYVCVNSLLAEKTPNSLWKEILQQGIKMYPANIYYYELLTCLYGLNDDPESGLEWCEKGLQKIPTHVNLLYLKGAHLRKLSELDLLNQVATNKELRLCKTVAAFNEFLLHAPSDHRHVPSAYYTLAVLNIHNKESWVHTRERDSVLRKVEYYFNKGKEAEGKMLPCYLPYGESDIKRQVEMVLMMAKRKQLSSRDHSIPKGMSQPAPKTVLDKKPYLMSPVRKRLILHHRGHQNDLVFDPENYKIHLTSTIASPKLKQTAPTKMSSLKPITLLEMNPTYDNILKDRIIDFTIIEDPVFGHPSIHLIVEDENGDVARLYIYNVEQNKEAAMNLAHGSTIAIMNPYMRIGANDGKNSIRNDEPSCLIYLDKVEKMCRFCREENAQQKCSRCKKACYCSRECQELDWKLLKHKIICSRQ